MLISMTLAGHMPTNQFALFFSYLEEATNEQNYTHGNGALNSRSQSLEDGFCPWVLPSNVQSVTILPYQNIEQHKNYTDFRSTII